MKKTATYSVLQMTQLEVSAIPYISGLVRNIKNRFAEGVQLLMAASILNPAKLPDPSDPNFNDYGNKEIQQLAYFCGAEIEVDFKGEKF